MVFVNLRALAVLSILALASSAFAQAEKATTPAPAEKAAAWPQNERIQALIKDSLPLCGDMKVTQKPWLRKMPAGMTASAVTVESARGSCAGEWLSISTGRSFYLGQPWFLDEVTGTPAEKLKEFGWKFMHETFTPVVSTDRSPEGLLKVQLTQTTERGKLPLEGLIDDKGTVFFIGRFHPIDNDLKTDRLKAFQPFIASAPVKGPADARVTVVEFSDFQCPSCRFAALTFKPIFDKYGDKIRYIRFDLPLVENHPWALTAAMAGRAVYRQKPEAFWDFKKQIYDNQEQLTAFTIDSFTRNFAQDHELDLKKYDADVADESIQKELLAGVAAAFMNDIRSTPSYLVNGTIVDPGNDGSALDQYIASQLK